MTSSIDESSRKVTRGSLKSSRLSSSSLSSLSSISSSRSLDIETISPAEGKKSTPAQVMSPRKNHKSTQLTSPKKSSRKSKKPSKPTRSKSTKSKSTQNKIDNTKKVLSAQEEEELSSALIAQLLAADSYGSFSHNQANDQDYYNDYYNEFNDPRSESTNSDDGTFKIDNEWVPSSSQKRKSNAPKSKRGSTKKRNLSSDSNIKLNSGNSKIPSLSSQALDEKSQESSHSNKKEENGALDNPTNPEFNTGVYTDKEETLFLEGLDMYGRNWKMVSNHMKSRDSKSIRSHAQKHFIKLYRDNLPLPNKVAESGLGYTLSGKPLDPNSAAARPYLGSILDAESRSNIQELDSQSSTKTKSKTKKEPFSASNPKNQDQKSKEESPYLDIITTTEPT
ncbi:hypothetical protein BB560_002959, partial [Smittium megazygosporum]